MAMYVDIPVWCHRSARRLTSTSGLHTLQSIYSTVMMSYDVEKQHGSIVQCVIKTMCLNIIS